MAKEVVTDHLANFFKVLTDLFMSLSIYPREKLKCHQVLVRFNRNLGMSGTRPRTKRISSMPFSR